MVNSAKDSSFKAWEALSLEWSQSGLPQKEFCEQRGINYKTFVNWRSVNKVATPRAVKRTVKASRQKSPLIPLRVIETDEGHSPLTPKPKVKSSTSSAITIVMPSGNRLLIEDGFDEKTLLRVLRVLKDAA